MFCESCGVRIVPGADAAPALPVRTAGGPAPIPASGRAPANASRLRSRAVLGIVAAGILSVTAAGVAFALSGGDEDQPAGAPSPGTTSQSGVTRSTAEPTSSQRTASPAASAGGFSPEGATRTAVSADATIAAADATLTAVGGAGQPASGATSAPSTVGPTQAATAAQPGATATSTRTATPRPPTATSTSQVIATVVIQATPTPVSTDNSSGVYGYLYFGGATCGGCGITLVGPSQLTMEANSNGYYDSLFYDQVLSPGTYNVYYPCQGNLIPTTPTTVTLKPGIENYFDIEIGFCG